MADVPTTPQTEPGIQYVGPENRVTWVEPPYQLRKYEPLRERYSLIRNGIDPDEHARQQAEKRKRQAAEEGDDEDSNGGNAPPAKRVHKTRSIQRQKRMERAKRPPVKKAHNYTPDYRFYLKGGDVYFVIEDTIFCVHKKKLTSSGGYLKDILDGGLVLAPEEVIRGRPVFHLDILGITLRQFRFFLAHLYRTIMIRQILPSGKPLLYFEAALEVLAASVRLDHHEAREAAIEGLETLFPTKGVPVIFKPAISGLRNKEEEQNFYRIFPLQALPVIQEYWVPAMLPMAYYHAAQLSREDLLNGVKVGDKLIKMDRSFAEVALKGHETLKVDRDTLLFKWLHDLVEGELKLGPRKVIPTCVDQNMRGNLACFPFLQRLLNQSNENLYIHGTNSLEGFTDKAKEIIAEHLCYHCLEHVLMQADRCLAASWWNLPKCFGLQPWEVLQKWQKSLAEGFTGNYN